MATNEIEAPESTAERVALWRALHLSDAPPHVLEDRIGLELLAPDGEWRQRPDMDLGFTVGFRAAIVARGRFVEDLVTARLEEGVRQYVIVGAGLDTFAQRHGGLDGRLRVFEVDEPGPQTWKRRRLVELGYGLPDWLRFAPVDLGAGTALVEELAGAGFDASAPSVVSSTGVTMYLAKSATRAMLAQLAGLAAGSTVAVTFLLPPELLDEADRAGLAASASGARASGTPFTSYYTPGEMLGLATEVGFARASHVPGRELAERYFTGRTDGLRPSSGEDFLIAET